MPDMGEHPNFCKNAGCDYTLKVTFADDSEQFVVLQAGFRGWFNPDIPAAAANPLDTSSYRVWGVNISAQRGIKNLELLETPEVWKGLPAVPRVLASRTIK